jgi:hypothetical protein
MSRDQNLSWTLNHYRAYLFAEEHQLYNTSHLSRAIQEQSRTAGLTLLTFARNRQAALAIAKPFDPDYSEQGDNPRLSFAGQAGHRPRVLAMAYAIDRAYPTRLQPELLSQYEKVSACSNFISCLSLETTIVTRLILASCFNTPVHKEDNSADLVSSSFQDSTVLSGLDTSEEWRMTTDSSTRSSIK